jgi:putative phosphoesterase
VEKGMKTLIIVSDTHGSIKGLDKIFPLIAENNYLIHLGDGCNDVRRARMEYPEKVYQCAGNCDFFCPLPTEEILEVEGVRILYCHGHTYGVKTGLETLAKVAKRKGCDVALYGHTHNALISEMDGVMLINPGSFRLPTDEGGSYCYLVIHDKKITPVLVGESAY